MDLINLIKEKYKNYYKKLPVSDVLDVYAVCKVFEINDPSGCLQHAIKKLLCSGARGSKDKGKDINEAILTLLRYLDLNGIEFILTESSPVKEKLNFPMNGEVIKEIKGRKFIQIYTEVEFCEGCIADSDTELCLRLNDPNHCPQYYQWKELLEENFTV